METVTPSAHRPSAPPLGTSPAAAPARLGSTLPPAGPAWYPSVMGTAILSTLLGLQSEGRPLVVGAAVVLLVTAAALLVGLTVAFARRVIVSPSALTSSITDVAVVPLWGTVSMALLAVGSATLTVTPLLAQVSPDLTAHVDAHVAVSLDAVLWAVGTVIGLVTALGFTAVLVRGDAGSPSPVWGLAVVAPMVSATTGASLVPHVGADLGRVALLAVVVGCFFVSLGIGAVVYAVAYHHHWRIAAIPVAASASIWVPLGMVGQSAAAAVTISTHAATVVTPAAVSALRALADGYAVAMLVLAVPVVVVAVRVTLTGFRARMPFSPGWWALTFPIGTVALGAHVLATSTGWGVVLLLAHLVTAVLIGTWTLCAVATTRAVVRS